MIVYGDPSYAASWSSLARSVRSRAEPLGSAPLGDDLRALLIQAGQLEQAAADALPGNDPRLAGVEAVTDSAAEWLVARAAGAAPTPAARTRLHRALRRLPEGPDLPLRVKLPEGFGFYSLYPEQYAAAAERWLAGGPDHRTAPFTVIGVRTIGTALSALVAAKLRAAGHPARRITVRPQGHPFERRAAVPELPSGTHVLVVDEGPGISGSSMAAVVRAVREQGVPAGRIALLPGHGGEPGPAASAEVRRLWAETPRFVVPASELRWNGNSLPELLAERTAGPTPVRMVREVGGGLWREEAYAVPAEWPAVAVPFERPKYLCRRADGSAVLWKFEGIAVLPDSRSQAEAAFAVQQQRAEAGWGIAPIAHHLGYVGTGWVEGERLSARDAKPALLRHLGRYVAAVAGPPREGGERQAGWKRLTEMLAGNTREALGDEPADRARRLAERAQHREATECDRSYGDGRMAPHEWLRTGRGRILKSDGTGHLLDHTVIGTQSVLWDLAGAAVEWELDEAGTGHLVEGFGAADPELLAFYRLAYAAFRMGQCVLCAALTGAEEQRRLERATVTYRGQLAALLAR